MKYIKTIFILFFLSLSVASFSQDTKKPVIKANSDSLIQRKIDSLINLPPHPDSAFISLSQLNKLADLIREKWDSKRDEAAAMQALQLLLNYAGEDLKNKRRSQLKKQ